MSNSQDLPIVVKSPLRFVIVGPGLPSPVVIISNSEETDDLVGFYSLREAGLSDLVENKYALYNRNLIESLFFPSSLKDTSRYHAVDAWSPGAEKSKLYSLVFEVRSETTEKTVDELTEKISHQISRISHAYENRNRDELVYCSQIMSTFMSVLADHLASISNKRKSLRRFMYGIFLIYAITAIGFGVFAFAKILYI